METGIMALSIVTLDRQPLTVGDTRYYLPSGQQRGEFAIILGPVSPDRLTETDPSLAYGTLQVLTAEYGVRTVWSLEVGVLVLDD
jgi:hypothetical protein